jgi:hypothetical protein
MVDEKGINDSRKVFTSVREERKDAEIFSKGAALFMLETKAGSMVADLEGILNAPRPKDELKFVHLIER